MMKKMMELGNKIDLFRRYLNDPIRRRYIDMNNMEEDWKSLGCPTLTVEKVNKVVFIDCKKFKDWIRFCA